MQITEIRIKAGKALDLISTQVFKGKQGSTERLPKIGVHPSGFWEMLSIESSFALLARNLGSKTRLFP